MTPRLPIAGLLFSTLAACTGGAEVDDSDSSSVSGTELAWPSPIVDTHQSSCYGTTSEIDCPGKSGEFYGQDAQYAGFAPSYTDSGDGTITDNITGLVWQWEQQDRVAYDEAEDLCADLDLGGRQWRVPNIKEAYSLILFDGATGSGAIDAVPDDAIPYIDDEVFDFAYGDVDDGERFIDVQFITTSLYVSTAFSDNHGLEPGEECFFGTNLADGRIKCYPTAPRSTFQLRCVSGDSAYGTNDFEDNGDSTVTDWATGLMWLQEDSAAHGASDDGTLDWGDALAWCEGLNHAGWDDWHLPNAKELQFLVDTERSVDTTDSAAIDAVFQSTPIIDEADDSNYGWYWSSTTHLDGLIPEANAVYVAFGEALGATTGVTTGLDLVLDVHGAGAQRSDPKTGSRSDYPQMGMGPQGDVRRVFNFARCVRTVTE